LVSFLVLKIFQDCVNPHKPIKVIVYKILLHNLTVKLS